MESTWSLLPAVTKAYITQMKSSINEREYLALGHIQLVFNKVYKFMRHDL